MCEWLASREWCDVQLQCGGRSFRAHRAVLASVSAFLRVPIFTTSLNTKLSLFMILHLIIVNFLSANTSRVSTRRNTNIYSLARL